MMPYLMVALKDPVHSASPLPFPNCFVHFCHEMVLAPITTNAVGVEQPLSASGSPSAGAAAAAVKSPSRAC